MKFNTFLESIVNIKDLPLLGEDAHAILSPPYRLELANKNIEKRKTAPEAAVMALFYPGKNDETHIVFILRKTYKGVHSAQVGFPGGKVEDSDTDLKHTALRETEEEIGVPMSAIDVLKTLSPIYIPPSNFMVFPFLGVSKKALKFIKQESEVEDVVEVKLTDLMSETSVVNTNVPTSYDREVELPALLLNNHVVWGATAMMLSEIKELLKQVL